jgi:hypothetical protein
MSKITKLDKLDKPTKKEEDIDLLIFYEVEKITNNLIKNIGDIDQDLLCEYVLQITDPKFDDNEIYFNFLNFIKRSAPKEDLKQLVRFEAKKIMNELKGLM